MAVGNAYSGKQIVTATTLGGASVDTVILTNPGFSVQVTNTSGGAPIFWTADSVGGACPVPTVNGVNCFVSGSVGSGVATRTRAGDFQFGTVVQLVSNGPTSYMVELQSVRATS